MQLLVATSLAYFFCFFCLGLVIASPGPCLSAMAERTGTNLANVSGVFVARAVGYFFGTILGGVALDSAQFRRRGHRILCLAMALCAASTALVPVSNTLAIICSFVTFQGFAMGVLDTSGNVLLIHLHSEGNVEPFMQAMHAFFGLGAFSSPLIMRATMGNSTAYDAAFYIYGGACLASTLAVWALPSPSPPHSDDDSSGSSKGCCAGAFSFTATKAEWRLVIAVSMLLLAYVGLEVAFGAFIHTYGTDALHYDSKKSQLLTSAFWGAITFSRVAAVLISMRASAVQMMWQNLAGTTLAAILLLFVGANATFSWVGAILFGLSMGSIFPTALNVAGKVMSIEGKVASCFVVGASLGELIIPWLNGVLIRILELACSSWPPLAAMHSSSLFFASFTLFNDRWISGTINLMLMQMKVAPQKCWSCKMWLSMQHKVNNNNLV